MISADTQAQLAVYRQKARDNTLTQDEMKDAIRLMRSERVGAAQVSASSRAAKSIAKEKAKPKAKPNGDDLLSELDDL